MSSKALDRFYDSLKYVDDLVDIHKKLQNGQGRRHHQETLHRSSIVLCVAAWEAYNEDVLIEASKYIRDTIVSKNPVPAWAQVLGDALVESIQGQERELQYL